MMLEKIAIKYLKWRLKASKLQLIIDSSGHNFIHNEKYSCPHGYQNWDDCAYCCRE